MRFITSSMAVRADDEPLAGFDAGAQVHVQLELGGGEDAVDGLLEAVATDVGELPGSNDFPDSALSLCVAPYT